MNYTCSSSQVYETLLSKVELYTVGTRFCTEARERLGSYRFASIVVFSFVMAYNNKKIGAIFGCHITFCLKPVPLILQIPNI